MGPATFGAFIPILGMLIGGFVIFAKSDIGRALAQRLGGNRDGDAELRSELEALRGEVEALRGDLVETQERLDFSERLLAGVRKEA